MTTQHATLAAEELAALRLIVEQGAAAARSMADDLDEDEEAAGIGDSWRASAALAETAFRKIGGDL